MENELTQIMGKGSPDFRERVRVGMLFVMGAVREVFLYQEFWPADMKPADETLVEGDNQLVTKKWQGYPPENLNIIGKPLPPMPDGSLFN